MLASKFRFHRRNHVNRVYKQGRLIRSGPLSLKYLVDDKNDTKVAVSVSKKVHKSAVVRNRIRRRVFGVVGRQLDSLPKGFQGVFGVFDQKVTDMDAKELESTISKLLAQAK